MHVRPTHRMTTSTTPAARQSDDTHQYRNTLRTPSQTAPEPIDLGTYIYVLCI